MVQSEVEGLVVAGESHGLVTRKEASKFLTRSQIETRLRTGAWVRVFPTSFRVVGAPVTWRQHVVALSLWAGKGAVLSHRTAACLHGFNHFPEGPLEVTTSRQLSAHEGVRIFRVPAVPKCDRAEVDDLNVTNAARTLLDLAALTDRLTLRATFDQALREKKTTLEKLEAAVARSRKRPGIIDVRSLLQEFQGAGGPTESELEREALDLIELAGLPTPKVQWAVIVGSKRRRLDLLFKGVVVEMDGYASHSGIDRFEDDRVRNNSLTAGGLRVLHWTWRAVHDRPDELIAELYAALNLRH